MKTVRHRTGQVFTITLLIVKRCTGLADIGGFAADVLVNGAVRAMGSGGKIAADLAGRARRTK
jgi:hypothetical protein